MTVSQRAAFGVVFAGLVLAACGGGGTSGPKTVKAALATDIQTIEAEVQNVQITVGEFQKSQTQANLDAVAQQAQTVHNDLNGDKDSMVNDFPSNGLLFSALDELKNSMGALVAYTGNPNAATLASFTTQYQTAVSDWDSAVAAIYAGTTSTPPSSLGG